MKKALSIFLAMAILISTLGISSLVTSQATDVTSHNKVLKVRATFSGDGSWYMPQINASYNYTIQPGDVYEYDIKVVQKVTNVTIGGIDAATNGQWLSEQAAWNTIKSTTDLKGITKFVADDLSSIADNVWLSRKIPLDSYAGQAIIHLRPVMLVAYGNANGTAIVYLDNIRIVNGSATKLNILQITMNTTEIV